MKKLIFIGILCCLSLAFLSACSVFNQVLKPEKTIKEPQEKTKPLSAEEYLDQLLSEDPCLLLPVEIERENNQPTPVLISWHHDQERQACLAFYRTSSGKHTIELFVRNAGEYAALHKQEGDEMMELENGAKGRYRTYRNPYYPEIIESASFTVTYKGWFIQANIESLFEKENEIEELLGNAAYFAIYVSGMREGFYMLSKEEADKRAEYHRTMRKKGLKENHYEMALKQKEKEKEDQKIKKERKEAIAAKESARKVALDNYCNAHCEILEAKESIAYEERIRQKVGYVDKYALYKAGESLVQWEDELAEWKSEYKNLTGKYPSPSQCRCY